MTDIDAVLTARERTHGDYSDVSRISQWLKCWYRSQPGWVNLTDKQQESLDMIANKTARILAGDATFADHWEDIAGYATLVARTLAK